MIEPGFKSQIPFRRGGVNTSAIGLVLLCITVLASLALVVRNTEALDHPTKTTLTLCHWQLEAGYREAVQAVIEDYEKLHPDVQVIQMPITEVLYPQWVNTQLVSGTAPDLCEMGQSSMLTHDEYTVQFFAAIGDEVVKPNPYNVGTPLEGVPWKETFIDGMRGGYKDSLGDYFMVPTTLYSTRLYCNTTLLQAACGTSEAPKSFQELIDDCQKVRTYSNTKMDGRVIPLVSCYNAWSVVDPYRVPFMASLEPELDTDLDGSISDIESYAALVSNEVNFNSPHIHGYFSAMKELTDQMQRGFAAMDRQTATFRFVNNNAAFLSTGSWDADGTVAAANEKGINVKIIEWPLPKPGEPYANLIAGRANEAAARGGGCYGLYKDSKHKALALDFLRYITSVAGNEKLNRLDQWPPIVLGAQPLDIMKPFMPNPIGFTSTVNFNIGSKVTGMYQSEALNYFQGEETYDQFARHYMAGLKDPSTGGDWACWFDYDQVWRSCRNQERVLERDAALQLMNSSEYSPSRYQRTLLQQIRHNNACDIQYQFKQFRGKPLPEF